MHRYLETKFWSTRSARMTTMAHFICVIPQPFYKNSYNCHLMTCEWLYLDFLMTILCRPFTNRREKLPRSKVSQCPESCSSSHWMGGGKREWEKDNIEWKTKFSAGRDTGMYLSCHMRWSHFPDNFPNFPNTPSSTCKFGIQK